MAQVRQHGVAFAKTTRPVIGSAVRREALFARCEYQMSTPFMGAGTCTFSNGAEYQVHIGS
jgi:hypothetical protein